jgi:hypothetical protein
LKNHSVACIGGHDLVAMALFRSIGDHPGAPGRISQDRLEGAKLRRINDADRIGEQEMARGIRIELITPYPSSPWAGSTNGKIVSQTFATSHRPRAVPRCAIVRSSSTLGRRN